MNHLVGQLLARAAGVPLTHIPYRGSAPAMNDLMGGQIVALMESLPTAIGYFNSRAHAAARRSAKPKGRRPCPTCRPSARRASRRSWRPTGSASRRRPAFRREIAKRWETEIADGPAERRGQGGISPGSASGPARLGAAAYTDLIRSELARWREVIRAGNIRAD